MYFKNKLGFMINIIQIKVLKTVHGKGFTNTVCQLLKVFSVKTNFFLQHILHFSISFSWRKQKSTETFYPSIVWIDSQISNQARMFWS